MAVVWGRCFGLARLWGMLTLGEDFALNMTVRSFYNVRARLFKRLGARTQEHAAAIAFRTGLLEVDRSEGAKICCGGAVRER